MSKNHVSVYGYADNRAQSDKEKGIGNVTPLVHVIGNRRGDFGGYETICFSPADARAVAMAIICAADMAENGLDYDKLVDSDFDHDSDDI